MKATICTLDPLPTRLFKSCFDALYPAVLLLDLSAAFDTVNHNLETVFGISETVLTWFRSYLTDRQQFVCMSGLQSEIGSVRTGVPQGSILGPLLFSISIFPLRLLLRSLGLNYHFYADDTQISIHFNALF